MIFFMRSIWIGALNMTYPLELISGITMYWFILGIVGAFALRRNEKYLTILFLLGTLGSLALLVVCCLAFGNPQLDDLSAFFLLLLSTTSVGIGLFSSHYFSHLHSQKKSVLFLLYHWLLACMVWIFLADDAYVFLIAWELMAISSYLMIVTTDSSAETLRSGFLYFLLTHLGALFLFIGFALMIHGAHDASFSAMRVAHLPPMYATAVFICVLIGFGTKAGMLPFHFWAPEAYPAVSSPISALMSGIMLKTAIYGLVRFIFDLLNEPNQIWGLIVLILGMSTAFFGVIMSAMQTDIKRLLAYSSIENSGIIVGAIGLALLFYASSQHLMATLALTAALFHSFSHALSKSLLFLGAGSVLHATGERNLGKLGGLISKMPWVSLFVLMGTFAISGIPPLSGFFAEWLLFQSFLFFPEIQPLYFSMLILVMAGLFALTIGLGAYVMVKFYGIIFLGKPRESELEHALDASFLERLGLGWLAAGCLLLGLFPALLLKVISPFTTSVFGESASTIFGDNHQVVSVTSEIARSNYSPSILLLFICFVMLVSYFLIRHFYGSSYRRGPAWDCGYPRQNARMQDSAEGMGQPIKHIFRAFIYIRVSSPEACDKNPQYHAQTEDRFWHGLYLPIYRLTVNVARWISKMQDGRINHYLLYSFVTMLIMLWWTLWQ
jgi:formate hydrogenlyase subunit 3/multisubunit Na+/H+ antiporter MnhD subunit